MARLMQPVMQRYPEPPAPSEQPVAPDVVLGPDVELPSHSRLPRLDLGVDWGSPWHDFRSSWHDFFRGPRAAGLRAARRLRLACRMDRRKNSRPRLHRFRALARGSYRPALPAHLAFS